MSRRAIGFSALVIVLSIIRGAAKCQTTEEQLEQSFHAGQIALRQGQFAAAAKEFQKVLQLDPVLLEAQVNLGLAYQGLLEYDDATHYLVKALRERPNLVGPNVIVGMDYLKLGSPDKGVPFLQTALKLDPSNRDAREALASSYLAQDNFGSSAEQFRRIADLNPDKPEALFKLGHEYLNLVAHLAYRGAHLYRDSAWGHRFLGDLFSQRGHWAEAITEYQKALSVAPKQPGLHASLGQAYLQDHKSQEAEAEFRLERQLESQPEGDRDPCNRDQDARCIESLKSRKHLSNSERLLLGKAYFRLQQYEPAADALGQVQGVDSENEEASYWLARTYQALGAEAYSKLQESFPNSWRAHQLRAEGYALSGNIDEAAKEFRAALELRPNEPELYEGLGELYLDHNSYDDAQPELERALALDPSRTHALYLLGKLYVRKHENEKAVPYLERALRLQPDLAEANSLLGTAYVRLRQFADAVPRLEKAAPSDHYGSVHYQLYLAYRKLGQAELAQKELARSQDLHKRYLERDEALIMGSPQPEPEPQ
ncbi:MAG: tetratricopeptide repeat protein [Acidobacteriaceae bacterium]|nr:tetratricopeptide repeat protein [Acidobacteriaceae bacterium]